MKNTLKILGILLMSLVLVTSCGKDEKDDNVASTTNELGLEKTKVTLKVEETFEVKITKGSGDYDVEIEELGIVFASVRGDVAGKAEVVLKGAKKGKTKVTVIDLKTNKKSEIIVTVEENTDGGEVNTDPQKIILTTSLLKGDKWNFKIYSTNGKVYDKIWIDFNNNGNKDEGEQVTKEYVKKDIDSQTIIIYGNVRDLDASMGYDDAENNLAALKIVNGKSLENLTVSGNEKLTSLELSEATALKLLECKYMKLQKIDVTKCANLERLWSEDNLLTSIDISKNTKLYQLGVEDNKLTSLDLTKSPQLEWVECQGNNLTSLDVSKIKKLYKLNCTRNPNLTCIKISEYQKTSKSFGILSSEWKKDSSAKYNTSCK